MKGDFTRLTFDKTKLYRGVLMQQGRVQLDSDWNEQVYIIEYRYSTFLGDFIGLNGAPADHAMTLSVVQPKEGEKHLLLSQGRYYVDGLLVENDKDNSTVPLPASPGWSLAFLDVWTDQVTAAEDADLREPALGGPDTSTRMKTRWVLRYHPLGNVTDQQLAEIGDQRRGAWPLPSVPKPEDIWQLPLSTGKMKVDQSSLALVDNRLYRVEVHTGSANAATPVFKWSRDNGSVVALVDYINAQTKTVTLQDNGLDVHNAFASVEWVEICDERCSTLGSPGYLVRVDPSQLGDRKLLLLENWNYGRPAVDLTAPIIVRRWDGNGGKGGFQLEGGLKVAFDNGLYRSGDYWLIPARQNSILDWEPNKFQRSHGTEHHFAALALVNTSGEVKPLEVTFQPITTGAVSKAGDTINGDLTVLKRLSVGSLPHLNAPLNVSATAEGKFASFATTAGTEAWRISQSSGSTPSLSISDTNDKGLTITTGGNILWGSGSALQCDQGGSIELWGDPNRDSSGKLGRPYIDFHCNGCTSTYEHADYDARIINDAVGRLTVKGLPGSPPLTLHLDGNVGIGTETPSAKLDVAGDTVISGKLAIGTKAPGDYSLLVTGGDTRIAAQNQSQSLFGIDKLVGEYSLRFCVDGDLNDEVMRLNTQGVELKMTNTTLDTDPGFSNTLTPKNIIKAWGVVQSGPQAGFSDGFNVLKIETNDPPYGATIYFKKPISEPYCIVGNFFDFLGLISFESFGPTNFNVYASYFELDSNYGVVALKPVNFKLIGRNFSFMVIGSQ